MYSAIVLWISQSCGYNCPLSMDRIPFHGHVFAPRRSPYPMALWSSAIFAHPSICRYLYQFPCAFCRTHLVTCTASLYQTPYLVNRWLYLASMIQPHLSKWDHKSNFLTFIQIFLFAPKFWKFMVKFAKFMSIKIFCVRIIPSTSTAIDAFPVATMCFSVTKNGPSADENNDDRV